MIYGEIIVKHIILARDNSVVSRAQSAIQNAI